MEDQIEEQSDDFVTRELLHYVVEFLRFLDFPETVEVFEEEKKRKRNLVASSLQLQPLSEEDREQLCATMLKEVDEGRRDAFFDLWYKYVPASMLGMDHYSQKMEFCMQVYFAVYPILPAAVAARGPPSRTDLSQRMKTLKTFLETKGAALAGTPEFLAFYALPFVPHPEQHPSFQGMFTAEWALEMRTNLQIFLDGLPTKDTIPKLFRMYDVFMNGRAPLSASFASAGAFAGVAAAGGAAAGRQPSSAGNQMTGGGRARPGSAAGGQRPLSGLLRGQKQLEEVAGTSGSIRGSFNGDALSQALNRGGANRARISGASSGQGVLALPAAAAAARSSGAGSAAGAGEDAAVAAQHSTLTLTPNRASMPGEADSPAPSAAWTVGGQSLTLSPSPGPEKSVASAASSDPFVDVGDSDEDPTSPSAMARHPLRTAASDVADDATPRMQAGKTKRGSAAGSGAAADEAADESAGDVDGSSPGATPMPMESASPDVDGGARASQSGSAAAAGKAARGGSAPGEMEEEEGGDDMGDKVVDDDHDGRPAADQNPANAIVASSVELATTYKVLGVVIPPLDYDLIKRDLAHGSDDLAARLLQALRWRLVTTAPGPDRFMVLTTWIERDLLCCLEPGSQGSVPDLVVQRRSPLVAEELARLLNAVASDRMGRAYLLNPEGKTLKALHAMLTEPWAKPPGGGGGSGAAAADADGAPPPAGDGTRDSVLQQQAIAALQKLSLKRRAQSEMIRLGLIGLVLELLKDADAVTEYTTEYGMALLMNLVLRTAGKSACDAPFLAETLLQVCEGHIESGNQQVRTYVNGTLYSVLERPAVREKARMRGMEDLLKAVANTASETFAVQVQHITAQLQSEAPAPPGAASDDEAEPDADAYYDFDAYGEADEAEESEAHDVKAAHGEALLCSKYLAQLEDAQRQAQHARSSVAALANDVLTSTPYDWSTHEEVAPGVADSLGSLKLGGGGGGGGGNGLNTSIMSTRSLFQTSLQGPLVRPSTPSGSRLSYSRPVSAALNRRTTGGGSGSQQATATATKRRDSSEARQAELKARAEAEAARLQGVRMKDGKVVKTTPDDYIQGFGQSKALPRTPPIGTMRSTGMYR